MRIADDRRLSGIAAAACLLIAAGAAPARAQGYGIYEQGACQMGRGGAGVADPCTDGSAIFFNPAGLARETATVASGGLTSIEPQGGFTNNSTRQVSTLRNRTFLAPTAYVATPIGRRTMVGIGLFAPYGLGTDWPASAEGRFLGYDSSIRSVYVQPTAAYRVTDRLFAGGGIDVSHTRLELRRRVDLAGLAITGTPFTFGQIGIPRGTDFADVDLTGSGMHVGAHVGVLFRATDRVSVGGRYLSRQRVTIGDGRLATRQIAVGPGLRVGLPGVPPGTPIDTILAPLFARGGPLSTQTVAAGVPLPDQLVLGVAVRATEKLKLLGDYQYVHWGLFDAVAITNEFAPPTVLVESYRDTHGIRIGAEYVAGRATLRGGFDAHTAGAPDQSVTPVLPEAPRREFSAGFGLPLPGVRIDVAYMYIDQQDRAGRSTDGGLAVPTVALNNGLYRYRAHLFGASLAVRF